jgi:cytochrome c-type biogenesis protein CcmH
MKNLLNELQFFISQFVGSARSISVRLVLLLLLVPLTGWADQEARPVADDPEVEKRMLELTEELRCLVCQNETIAESRADFSNDMRREIRELIKANKTDEEIIEFLVERYGDFVLYNPPLKSTTFLLWFGPMILFIAGSITLFLYLRRRRQQVEDTEIPISEDAQKKAEALLNENKGNNA